MSIYICHVTDRLGRIHRVEVSGSDRTAAMRDALAAIPSSERVSIKAERNEREARNAMISPLDRYAIPRPPARIPRPRHPIGPTIGTLVLMALIGVMLAWRG